MKEFKVRAASSSTNKKHDVFKLHKDDSITWTEAKMRRDNNYQPWQIKHGSGRTARRFKAVKEGGVNDNASYFVFYKPDENSDTYEVRPVDDWYSVSATQRYKTLTAEEAEQKFEQRHKILNHFSVMKKGENGDEAGSSGQDRKSFKVSEMDDWDNDGDGDNSDRDSFDDDNDSKKKARKKSIKKEKDEVDAPEEGKEDSDEGDFEQREVDYMTDISSDSSDDEEERKDETDVKGIAEEEALRDLLSTDDEEDAENPQQKSKVNQNKASMEIKQGVDGESSDDSLDSDDYDVDEDKMDSMFNEKGLPKELNMARQERIEPASSSRQQAGGSGTSVAATAVPVTSNKRKLVPESSFQPAQQPQPKRPCTIEAASSSSQPPNSVEKIVEDLVVKYLSRKPMTLKNLLKEINSKLKRMMGSTPDLDKSLVPTIAHIFKKLDPDKQKINDATYFSLKQCR